MLTPGSSEKLKRLTERLTGWGRVAESELSHLVVARKANSLRFSDDGVIPNHPAWPLIHYRSPIAFPADSDPAAIFEDLFRHNGWGRSWRGGIYTYVHYHSRTHEVLGVARGRAKVRFGGNRGRTCYGKAGRGDVRLEMTSPLLGMKPSASTAVHLDRGGSGHTFGPIRACRRVLPAIRAREPRWGEDLHASHR